MATAAAAHAVPAPEDDSSANGGNATGNVAVAAESDTPVPPQLVYELSLLFFKQANANGQLDYETRVDLVALHRQATLGPYSDDKCEQPGFFDFVGKDRKSAWIALGDLSAEDAKEAFCALLEERVQSYTPWMAARLREREERERKAREQAERERRAREQAQREALERQRQEQLRLSQEAQRREAQRQQQLQQQASMQHHHATGTGNGNGSGTSESSAAGTAGSSNTTNTATAAAAGRQPLDFDMTTATRLPRSSLTDPQFIEAFRKALRGSPESEALVGSGETLTVRVPMPSSRRTQILWQFTTEERDISFGVDFEVKAADGSVRLEPVLNSTRINAHLEVVTGSHVSDKDGTWLLKFDNSYSYFRGKTILYRVLCSEV